MATEKLLNFYFESDGNKKNEIMLALAHLNLKVGYQFFHTIRLSETSNKEKEWVEVILKRVISTIKNHKWMVELLYQQDCEKHVSWFTEG